MPKKVGKPFNSSPRSVKDRLDGKLRNIPVIPGFSMEQYRWIKKILLAEAEEYSNGRVYTNNEDR